MMKGCLLKSDPMMRQNTMPVQLRGRQQRLQHGTVHGMLDFLDDPKGASAVELESRASDKAIRAKG